MCFPKNKNSPSAYLVPYFVELLLVDAMRRPGANPFLVEIVVMKRHHALHLVPLRKARVDAQPSILRGGGDESIEEAKAVCRGERRRLRDGREVGGR
jgi:hypothetical protein